jgi:TonB family protein
MQGQKRTLWHDMAVAAMMMACMAAPTGQAAPLTVARLEALKSTSNDPAGDSFIGQPQELRALVDAFVADNSLVSPMLLYMASNTAIRQGQVEQAAFLLYAAQIRRAFDFDRYNISTRADGNNAATYLGFLNQTTGMSVNPAIMRDPARFAAVIARLEKWNVVPSADAYYPEFEEAKGFKLPRDQWAAKGAEIKEDFLTKFGRPTAKTLREKGRLPEMKDVEKDYKSVILVPPPAPAPSKPPALSPEDMPVRVGGDVPEPKKIKHVDPQFPPGSSGAVIYQITVDKRGKVAEVEVLRGYPGLEEAGERALRQWEYEPVLVKGKPVSVLLTVSLRTPLPPP